MEEHPANTDEIYATIKVKEITSGLSPQEFK